MKKITLSKNDTSVEITQGGIYEIDGYSYNVTVDATNGEITVSRLCDNVIDTAIKDEKISILPKSDEFANDDKRTLPKLDKYYKFVGDTFDWGEVANAYGYGTYARYNLHSDCPKCIKSDDAKKIQFFDVVIDGYTYDEIIKRFSEIFNFHYETLSNENLEVGATEVFAEDFFGYFTYFENGYHYFNEIYGAYNHKCFQINASKEFSGSLQGELVNVVVKKENISDYSIFFREVTSNFNPNKEKYNVPSTISGILDALNETTSKAVSFVASNANDFTAGIQSILLSKYYTNAKTFHFLFYYSSGANYIDCIIDISEDRKATLKIAASDYFSYNYDSLFNDGMLADVLKISEAISKMNDDSDFDNVSYTDENGNTVNLELYYSKFLSENKILEDRLMYGSKSNIDMTIDKIEAPRSIATLLESKVIFNGASITVTKEDMLYNEDTGVLEVFKIRSGEYYFINKDLISALKDKSTLLVNGNLVNLLMVNFINDNNITTLIKDSANVEYKKDDYFYMPSIRIASQDETNIISSLSAEKVTGNIYNYGTSSKGSFYGPISGPQIMNSSVKEYNGPIFGNSSNLSYHDTGLSQTELIAERDEFIGNMLNKNNLLEYGRYPEFIKNLNKLNGADVSDGIIKPLDINLEPFYKTFSGNGYSYSIGKLPTIKNISTIDEEIADYTRSFVDIDKSFIYSLKDAMVFLDENLENFTKQLYSHANIITMLERQETAYVFKISDISADNGSGPDANYYTGIVISDRDSIPDSITQYGPHGTNIINYTVESIGSFGTTFDGSSYSFSSNIPNLKGINVSKYAAGIDTGFILVDADFQTDSFYREAEQEDGKVAYTFTKNDDGSVDIVWNNGGDIDAKFFTINDQKVLIPTGGN